VPDVTIISFFDKGRNRVRLKRALLDFRSRKVFTALKIFGIAFGFARNEAVMNKPERRNDAATVFRRRYVNDSFPVEMRKLK